MEDYLECEFFIIRRKINNFLEKERFEGFTKAFTGVQKIFFHNLFITDSLNKPAKNYYGEFSNKNNVTKGVTVSIGIKKIRLKKLNHPFLSLPFHLKPQIDRTTGVWRTIDIRVEIFWKFKSLKENKAKKKPLNKIKKFFLLESIRFLNFHSITKKFNISDKTKLKAYAFFF